MTRIDKTSSVFHLLEMTPANRKSKSSKSAKYENKAVSGINKNTGALRQQLAEVINEFDLSLNKDRLKAREVLVRKMIHWHFHEYETSASGLSNLVTRVNKQLSKTPLALEKLEQLLFELQA